MDSNTKMRKGFMKGKLVMSFIRVSKPSTAMQPYTTTKMVRTSDHIPTHIKPATANQKTTLPSPSSSSLIMNQEKVNPQPKHRVSYVIPQTTGTYGVFENPYGVVVDEAVDAKATNYISCVQERFKHEHLINERVEPAIKLA